MPIKFGGFGRKDYESDNNHERQEEKPAKEERVKPDKDRGQKYEDLRKKREGK